MNLELWRRFLEELPAPASLLTKRGELLAHNREAAGLFGGASPVACLGVDETAAFQARLERPEGASRTTGRFRFSRPAGERLVLEVRVADIRVEDAGEGTTACLVQWWDVTAALGHIACLQQSLDMLDHVRDAIIATDLQGVVTFWNPGAERLFGWRADEMIGRPYTDRLPPEARESVAEHIASRAAGTVFEGEFLDWRKDGSRVWIDARVTRFLNAEGEPIGIVGISHDITLRKQTEEALSASRARLKAILHAIPDVIFIVRPDMTVAEVFSSQPEEMVHPPEYYLSRQLNEFTPADVLTALRPVLERVASTGKPETLSLAGEFHERMYYLDTHIVPDSPSGWIILARDETEEVLKERELRRKIEQSRKLESLGMLAGGIAYDFESMLTAILGFSDLARDSIPPDLPAARHVGEIESSARRASELCRQLLAYAGRAPRVNRPIDLSHMVDEMRDQLSAMVPRGCELVFDVERDLPAIEADKAQLRQVLIHLLTNSTDASTERGGTITLRTGVKPIDSPQQYATVAAVTAKPGEYVFLEVTDNGSGMSAATTARIFDPFFSTKPGGRGLGLAAVLGVVRGHGGLIRVVSKPQAGTTVELLLPASRLPVEPLTVLPRKRRSGTLARRVLAIDDEPALRLMIRTALEEAGVTVELARSGTEGRERFLSGESRFDAVIVDLTLPGISGYDLVKEFVAHDPGLPVIVISGYSAEQVVEKFSFCARFGFVSKPFTARDLVAALARVTAT